MVLIPAFTISELSEAFLIGFLIISHARYTILKANWELQNIPVLGNMARRWLLLVLGFLAAVGLISALLPVSYSVGIMDTIGTIVRWVFYVLVQIAFFVLFAISYVIGLILSLFTGKPAGTAPSMAQPVAPPVPAAMPGDPNPWWQLIRSLLFWTVLFGIVGYSVFQFLVYRLHLLDNVRLQRLIGWFQRLFASIRRTARRAVHDVRQRIAARLAASRKRAEQRRWRYVSLRKLSPRDRVRYFYLSVLRRSAEQGYARPPSATPMEFEPKLANELPEVAGEVGTLTQAFVEARYSEHPLEGPQAAGVQGVWRRVRRALTAHKRHTDAP